MLKMARRVTAGPKCSEAKNNPWPEIIPAGRILEQFNKNEKGLANDKPIDRMPTPIIIGPMLIANLTNLIQFFLRALNFPFAHARHAHLRTNTHYL